MAGFDPTKTDLREEAERGINHLQDEISVLSNLLSDTLKTLNTPREPTALIPDAPKIANATSGARADSRQPITSSRGLLETVGQELARRAADKAAEKDKSPQQNPDRPKAELFVFKWSPGGLIYDPADSS